MAKLYTSSDVLLTRSVQVVPSPQPIKIENRLLNGQLDVQIIGTAESVYEIICFVPYAEMLLIQTASNTGDTVKLFQEGVTYDCYIKGNPEFTLASRGVAASRYYEGRISLSVVEE